MGCGFLAQVHAVALPNGDLLLAYDDDANLRTPLALAMSRDGGASWHRVRSSREETGLASVT